jgi:mono/diheme cytochrome c family protein
MNVRRSVLISLLPVLLIAGCSKQSTPASTNANVTRNTPAATPDVFATARELFAKNCQNCHGPTGTGGPVKLEDGTKLKVPSLREGHALRHPDSDFLKQINKGGDGMPAFKDKLTPPQIAELVRFIRHEFQAGAQSSPK